LVDDLSSIGSAEAEPSGPAPQNPVAMVDFCGFLSMQEAGHAREQLRRRRIPTEIVLKEPPGADLDAPPEDEYWLRVDGSRIREVQAVMESLEGGIPQMPGGTFACSECGNEVADEESFCPKCGARFE